MLKFILNLTSDYGDTYSFVAANIAAVVPHRKPWWNAWTRCQTEVVLVSGDGFLVREGHTYVIQELEKLLALQSA